jgi:hypothetical protein
MIQNPLHSPEEMRQISDLAHFVEGLVLGAAALIALIQAHDFLVRGKQRYAWPTLVIVAGVFLLAYLVVPHHGLALARTQWAFVFGDPQQRQHVLISLLVFAGGTSELLTLTGRVSGRVWRLMWPATLVVVGLLFMLHAQHGTTESVMEAVLLHRVLGSTFVVAGILAAANVVRLVRSKALASSWSLALLVAAVLLVAYREPEGAYHENAPGHAGSHPTGPETRP